VLLNKTPPLPDHNPRKNHNSFLATIFFNHTKHTRKSKAISHLSSHNIQKEYREFTHLTKHALNILTISPPNKGRRKMTDNQPKEIRVTKNGPYLVKGTIPLSQKTIQYDRHNDSCQWRDAQTYPLQEHYALCRCGQSANKLYCDGTHLKIHFDVTETASHTNFHDHAQITNGPTLRLADAKLLCASARFCHRAGGIWNIIPTTNKSENKQTAIEEAADCPSGRLVLFDTATGKQIEPTFQPSIVAIEDPSMHISGPLWIRGGIPILSADGISYATRNRVTICRCGKSKNKPFCDSSHWPE
jgi:CDGSH-type Zn-finger protein